MAAPSQMRWMWRGTIAFIIVIGWIFIASQNHFHLTPPLVFVCLGYFAVVIMIYNLWRTGAAAVATNTEDDGPDAWGKPIGELGSLLREKKTMLKAIKEAEFDQQMGKLSKVDADRMIKVYRARAIEVIKEIDRFESGKVGTVREQIEREVRARIELENKSAKNAEDKATRAAKAEAKKADAAKPKKAEPASAATSEAAKPEPIEAKAESIEAKSADAVTAKAAEPDVKPVDAVTAKAAEPEAKPAESASDAVAASIAGPAESERKEARQ
jgi:colicin import membrane protein